MIRMITKQHKKFALPCPCPKTRKIEKTLTALRFAKRPAVGRPRRVPNLLKPAGWPDVTNRDPGQGEPMTDYEEEQVPS